MKKYIALFCLVCFGMAGEARAGFWDTLFHKSPPAIPAVPAAPMTFITMGNGVAYAKATRKIAFSRYDPTIKGGPSLDGKTVDTGTFELWTANADGSKERCLSCFDIPGGPLRSQHKGAPTWHSSGKWMVVAVEMRERQMTHAQTTPRHGLFNDLWAVSADGKKWYQLTHYAGTATKARFPEAPAGALKPHFSNAGGKLVWSEMIGGDAQHPFGVWRLAVADFTFGPHGAELRNKRTFTPGAEGASYYEPCSFSPDDNQVLVSSDNGTKAPGFMRLHLWDMRRGTLTALTPATDQYEKQGIFSPDGVRIAYMSSRDQPAKFTPEIGLRSLSTDIWTMRKDGGNAKRLTAINPQDPAHNLSGQHLVVPVSWMNNRSLLFDVDLIEDGKQNFSDNRIYRIDLQKQ